MLISSIYERSLRCCSRFLKFPAQQRPHNHRQRLFSSLCNSDQHPPILVQPRKQEDSSLPMVTWPQTMQLSAMAKLFKQIDAKAPYTTVRNVELSGIFDESALTQSINQQLNRHYLFHCTPNQRLDHNYWELNQRQDINIIFDPRDAKTISLDYVQHGFDTTTPPLFKVIVANATKPTDVPSNYNIVFAAPHYLLCGGSFHQIITDILDHYSNLLTHTTPNTTPLPVMKHLTEHTSTTPALSSAHLVPIKKKSPLTLLPARSMNFFIMSLGKLAKTSNLNARLAALFATSLLQTMQHYSEPAPLRLKSARSSRLDYNPPIEKDMMGTWIRQISTTIDDKDIQDPLRLPQTLRTALQSRNYSVIAPTADHIETTSPLLGFSNLGNKSMLSPTSPITVNRITTISNLVSAYGGKWQIFANGLSLNGNTEFALWYVDQHWTKNELSTFQSHLANNVNTFELTQKQHQDVLSAPLFTPTFNPSPSLATTTAKPCKTGFNYELSSTTIALGPINDSPNALNVLCENRNDFQCPPYITDQEFYTVARNQEQQYFNLLKDHCPNIANARVFMPGAGSLLNFTSSLIDLGVSELVCSDIVAKNQNQLADQNLHHLQHCATSIKFSHQLSATDHASILLCDNQANTFDVVIIPWISMYLTDTDYDQLLKQSRLLLKDNGFLIERFSAKQAFKAPQTSLALSTNFRSASSISGFHQQAQFTPKSMHVIEAFLKWTDQQKILFSINKSEDSL